MTPQEQMTDKLQKRCIHFTGLMGKVCRAGIVYREVRTEEPLCFPCISTGGECSKAKYPTKEEAEVEAKKMEDEAVAGVAMYLLVKDHHRKTGQQSGKIQCTCGGMIGYYVASNGHIRASCSQCKTTFVQ